MKDHVRILVIGDGGVGKSSLISSYVSRHFPQEVPAVVADVDIPPETTANFVRVTLRDSSATPAGADHARDATLREADSIIALYDVTRPETFSSLMRFWLPLIRDLLNSGPCDKESHKQTTRNGDDTTPFPLVGDKVSPISSHEATLSSVATGSSVPSVPVAKPVILVGTKTDLLVEDQDIKPLKKLMAAFPFVLNCWNCSALNLQNVDEIFYNAQVLVNFPYSPLFDVATQEFTPAARCAFQRVFRIFDVDGDNLLNDDELAETEYRCFSGSISTEELMVLKHQISKLVPGGVVKNAFTFEGFLGLVKLNLDNHVYQYPWAILRSFDYDDNLNVQVPDGIKAPPAVPFGRSTQLTEGAISFLWALANNAHQEYENPIIAAQVLAAVEDSGSESEEDSSRLTWDALRQILSVITISSDADPWHDPPSFKTPWRCDASVEQRILLSELSHNGASLSFDAWMTHWHILAAHKPVEVQILLFNLGYVERGDLGICVSAETVFALQMKIATSKWDRLLHWCGFSASIASSPRNVLHVCVLGGNGVGKSSFVWNMSGLRAPWNSEELGFEFKKYNNAILVGGRRQKRNSNNLEAPLSGTYVVGGCNSADMNGFDSAIPSSRLIKDDRYTTDPLYLSVVAVPLDFAERWMNENLGWCDLVVLMFECASAPSLELAMQLEAELPDDKPRLFIGSKIDLIPSSDVYAARSSAVSVEEEESRRKNSAVLSAHEAVLQKVTLHIQDNHLPPVSFTSTIGYGNSDASPPVSVDAGIVDAYDSILKVLDNPESGIPRRNARRSEQSCSDRLKNFVKSHPFLTFSASVLGIASLSICITRYNKEVKEWLRAMYERTMGLLVHTGGIFSTNYDGSGA